MFRAVQVRPERHAFVRNFSQRRKTKNLVPAGIRQNRAGPRHKPVQPAEFSNQLMARPQIKMIGVGEDDARAQFFERFVRQCL